MTASERPNRLQPGKPPDKLPEAVMAPRRPVSLVWVIPIVALLIGGWLPYKAYSERGPEIRIEFKSAASLEAGKTKVKVGKVAAIDLDEDLQKVVGLPPSSSPGWERYLTRKTRFWVTRPRVPASQVLGLDTPLSGAYIAVDPGQA